MIAIQVRGTICYACKANCIRTGTTLSDGNMEYIQTRQSKHCGFSIYVFDNSKSKSMVRLVRAEKIVLSGLIFARKIARMILIQNI